MGQVVHSGFRLPPASGGEGYVIKLSTFSANYSVALAVDPLMTSPEGDAISGETVQQGGGYRNLLRITTAFDANTHNGGDYIYTYGHIT